MYQGVNVMMTTFGDLFQFRVKINVMTGTEATCRPHECRLPQCRLPECRFYNISPNVAPLNVALI
jgi:hypothetical protein